MAYTIALLFIGCLVMVGHCKRIFSILLIMSSQAAHYVSEVLFLYVNKIYLPIVHGQPYNVSHVTGRPGPYNTYEDGHGNATTLVSSLIENKLTLQWCVARDCQTKGEPGENHCFCCLNAPGAPCFYSRMDCQSKCPTFPPGK